MFCIEVVAFGSLVPAAGKEITRHREPCLGACKAGFSFGSDAATRTWLTWSLAGIKA